MLRMTCCQSRKKKVRKLIKKKKINSSVLELWC